MTELALPLACVSAILCNMVIVQASSASYHRIQVGGPANQITTGEIRIDLPSESFQNLKFNITPYSLQNEYSPYYDQYRAGYQPSEYSPPKVQPYKQGSQSAYKSPPQVSYKPAHVVSYEASPSVPHPVYSYPQTTYNQPSYTQPAHNQPQVSYNQPSYTQQKVSYNQQYNQHTYKQPQVSYNRPSYNPIQAIQPSYQPKNPLYSYKPIKTTAQSTKPTNESSEGDFPSYSSNPYPYPYQQTGNRKPVTQKITSVVDLKETEEITEAAPVEEVTEDERSGKTVTENYSGNSENLYTKVFKQFKSYDIDGDAGSDSETEEAREAKTLDADVEDVDQNSVDSVASSTLLPEVIPIIFEEAGVSAKDNTLLRTTKSVESETSLTTSSATTTITPTTTARLTTTTTTKATTTTTSITTTASTTTTTASSIRRRPVISFFHDLTTSTSPPPIQSVTPPGEIGQSILDKIRTATLTVEKLLDSEEEITLNSTEDKNNAVRSEDEDTDGELLESEIDENGDEEKSRERRKIIKVSKSKTNAVNQGSKFYSHWQNGRWF